uniref:Mitochondrial carrier protein n=1 Tax=Phaeomonas parva TaxID=124430 RepID=A0A7S1UI93_9STRA
MAVYRNPFEAFMRILQTEGVGALYKGVGAVVVAAAPAQGLYFMSYELCRDAIGAFGGEGMRQSAAGTFVAGAFAQLGGSVAWVPMDVVKERLQVEGQMTVKETYGGSLQALQRIIKTEGVLGLYRAYWIHQLTWAPFNGLYFTLYESFKTFAKENDFYPMTWEGTAAGVIAGAVTNPADLVKTRLQVARANPGVFDYDNTVDCAVKIVRREGVMGLFDGVGARVLVIAPRLALAVSSYEYLKDWMAPAPAPR